MKRLSLLALLLAAIGCGQSPEAHLADAVAARDAGDAETAVASYTSAIAADESLLDARMDRGLLLVELERHEEAVADFTAVVEASPDDEPDVEALLARGAALQALGRHAEAVEDLSTAADSDELDVSFYRLRAVSWSALGEFEAAIEDASMAIRLAPDDPDLYRERAAFRDEAGEANGVAVDERLTELTTEIVADSDAAAARRQRGRAFFELDEYELALVDLNVVCEADADDAVARLYRGHTHYVLGDDAAALADYAVVVASAGELAGEARAARATVHQDQGRFPEAVRDYTAAVELSPEDDDLLATLAWLLATCDVDDVRDGDRAVEYAKRACLLTDWNDWFCLDAHAAASAEAGDFKFAVLCQERAVAIAPEERVGELDARRILYRARQPYRANDD